MSHADMGQLQCAQLHNFTTISFLSNYSYKYTFYESRLITVTITVLLMQLDYNYFLPSLSN